MKTSLLLAIAGIGQSSLSLPIHGEDTTYITSNGTVRATPHTGPGGAVTITNPLSNWPVAGIAQQAAAEAASADRAPKPVPWSEIGAKAGAGYQGEGLTVTANGEGARLRCAFQRLDGEATREGLWLTSTLTNQVNERFRVRATAIGRNLHRASEHLSVGTEPDASRLPGTGTVVVDGQVVRFIRQGAVEEYSVSMDGVRQDFVVTEKPAGAGELQVELEVSGAKVEVMPGGARLVLEPSGRKIAYSRLRATDATGKELPARLVAPAKSEIRNPK